MPDPRTSWRRYADAAKRREVVLRIADRLGRGRGRARFLDALRLPPPSPRPDLRGWVSRGLAACWIGHATMLLRVGGRTILTDPIFSPRAGVGLGPLTLGPTRLQAPAVAIGRLPRVDVILLSHAHFDHLDRPSLHKLARRFSSATVVCAAGTRDLVDDLPFRDVRELGWGESMDARGLRVTAVPVEHWGPRVFYDDWRTYNAYLIESADSRVLFGGDTAFTRAWNGLGPLDLLCVGIGAYDPYVRAHATPEQAWQMATACGARRVAAMHHSTFRLSREPTDEPLQRLLAAAGDERRRVVIRRVGDLWSA